MARPSSILGSKYREEIVECLRSGWSPETVVWWLKLRYREHCPDLPSVRALYRHRKTYIPKDKIVPASLIREKLKEVDYQVDLLQTLGRAIWALEQRLACGWRLEQESSNGVLSPNTDRAALTLLEYLREYRRVAQDLGILPAKPEQLLMEVHQTQEIVASPEQLKDLAEAVALANGRILPPPTGN